MESSILKELSSIIFKDDLSLAYTGKFSDSMTDKIIEMSEAYLDTHMQLNKLRKRTSFLVAECFQNVVRHSTKDPDSQHRTEGKESFLIRFYGNKCVIASENALPNDKMEGLKKQLEDVNRYNKEELKALHKITLESGGFSDKGGAGLGLIEMARKTGNKLYYSFDALDEVHSAFYLMLVLENAEDEAIPTDHTPEMKVVKEIIIKLKAANQFLLYNGDFADDVIMPVIQIIENNLDTHQGPLAPKIKLYYAAVESLQIVSQLSSFKNGKQTGTLALGKTADGYVINTLNPVDDDTRDELVQLMEEIKRYSQEEMKTIFREKTKAGTFTGLGFIELTRVSKSWQFGFFIPADAPQHFFYQMHV